MLNIIIFAILFFFVCDNGLLPAARDLSTQRREIAIVNDDKIAGIAARPASEALPKETPFLEPGDDEKNFEEFGGAQGFYKKIEELRLGPENDCDFGDEKPGECFYEEPKEQEEKIAQLYLLVQAIKNSNKALFEIIYSSIRWDITQTCIVDEVGSNTENRLPYCGFYSLLHIAALNLCKIIDRAHSGGYGLEASWSQASDIFLSLLLRNLNDITIKEPSDIFEPFDILGLKKFKNLSRLTLLELMMAYRKIAMFVINELKTWRHGKREAQIVLLFELVSRMTWTPGDWAPKTREKIYTECIYYAAQMGYKSLVQELLVSSKILCNRYYYRFLYCSLIGMIEAEGAADEKSSVCPKQWTADMLKPLGDVPLHPEVNLMMLFHDLVGDLVKKYCKLVVEHEKNKMLIVIEAVLCCAGSKHFLYHDILRHAVLIAKKCDVSRDRLDARVIEALCKTHTVIL